MDETLRKLTDNLFRDDPETESRIKNDTERYRKGFSEVELAYPDGRKVENAKIHFRLKRHEFFFGCNLFMLDEFPDAEHNSAYRETFASLFNLATIPFYWTDLEPEDGKLRFMKNSRKIYRRPPPDICLEYCLANGITPKGHPLLWDHYYPVLMLKRENDWLTNRFERHFREIAERYRDNLKMWDVINEVLSWNPLKTPMPPEHVELVFHLAEKYFGTGSFFLYNETTENSWDRFNGPYTPVNLLCEHLLRKGCRLSGVGLQYHIFKTDPAQMLEHGYQHTRFNPGHLFRVMDSHAANSIPFQVSEVTLSGRDSLGGSLMQAEIAERLYRLWFSHPLCHGILWWNLVDGTANDAPMGSDDGENKHRGGLFNYDFSEKPAAEVLRRLICKEWKTEYTMPYCSRAVNKLHGFYGLYECIVKVGAANHVFELEHFKNTSKKHLLVIQ